MSKLFITLVAALALATSSLAQTPAQVTVNAKGDDVRSVLHDLFGQAKQNYVLDPGVRFVLYLSLKDVEFEEALTLVCKQAGLTYDLQNGIYFVSKAKTAKPVEKPAVKEPEKPKGKLPEAVLSKKVTTRLTKVDLRTLFMEFGKQAGLTFEVGADVPNYKVDAFLIGTSLKYALDNVTKAAGLTYKFTDNLTIAIVKPEDPNRIVVHKE